MFVVNEDDIAVVIVINEDDIAVEPESWFDLGRHLAMQGQKSLQHPWIARHAE